MPMNVSLSLPDRVQGLLQERQQYAEAIVAIDQTLEQINSLLGSAAATTKPAVKAVAMPVAAPTLSGRGRARRPGELPTTGVQSILALVKARGNPTTSQINARFKAEGRHSTADTLLGELVKKGVLKKNPLGGRLGSEYSLASSAPVAAAVAASAKKKLSPRGNYSITAQDLVLNFVKQKGQPTSQDLKAMWAKAGRQGRLKNELSRLVSIGKLKRTPLKDGLGSTYKLA
jgi:predicted transcriptional regulator